jgi:hypothetical protein
VRSILSGMLDVSRISSIRPLIWTSLIRKAKSGHVGKVLRQVVLAE